MNRRTFFRGVFGTLLGFLGLTNDDAPGCKVGNVVAGAPSPAGRLCSYRAKKLVKSLSYYRYSNYGR